MTNDRARRTPVLVLPGLAASDRSTQVIRTSLVSAGHYAHGWRLGRNQGPTDAMVADLRARLFEVYERHHRRVALVGWSLGGLYAHWLARADPDRIHSVTTLGSPLARNGSLPPALDVPTTSVYSRNDRIVPWRASLIDDRAPRHQNVESRSSHLTLGFDPAVLHLINDRVGQRPEQWERFEPPIWLRLAFPTTGAAA